MQIHSVPEKFQPHFVSTYPSYSSGKNIEEIVFDILKEKQNDIETQYIYLPIFWTSYYILHNYVENIDEICDYLQTLDKSKKYFTIVQSDSGILVKNYNIDLTIFTAGGGGLNYKSSIIDVNFHGLNRSIFVGNKGTYDIPLICNPEFSNVELNRDIFCSFMGRFDTHPCRMRMKDVLQNISNIKMYNSHGYEEYKNIISRSVFTLTPRGFGYTSFRLYEAILGGSIPIYIWDNAISLPFSEEIKWDEFCVIVHNNDIEDIPSILNNIDVLKMQQKLKEVRHFFIFENIIKYIISKISTP